MAKTADNFPSLRAQALATLQQLAQCPATSFHEDAVAAYLTSRLKQLGLHPVEDEYGNVLAHHSTGQPAYTLALVAHMDHPGVEVIDSGPDSAICQLLGWLDPQYLAVGLPLLLFADGRVIPGTISSVATARNALRTTLVLRVSAQPPVGAFGVFALPPFDYRPPKVFMRAADDLVACAVMLLAAERLVSSAIHADVYFAFTRAEEVGLVGAALLARSHRIPLDAVVVSLECSQALPGARSGKGPVIRVGDAGRTFDWEGEQLLWRARGSLANNRRLRVQRQLMSGGTCEASAFQAYGYRVTGLAIPVRNYHNQGPRFALAPEAVDVNDIATLVYLLGALVAIGQQPHADTLGARLGAVADEAVPALSKRAGKTRKMGETL